MQNILGDRAEYILTQNRFTFNTCTTVAGGEFLGIGLVDEV